MAGECRTCTERGRRGYCAPARCYCAHETCHGWHRIDLAGATTLSGDTDRVEVLWSNRPIGEPDLFSLDGGAA